MSSTIDPFIGKTIAGFQLEQLIGEGGMGRVYLATQVRLKRHVAVKILPNQMVFKNKQFVERFLREATTAAQLTHPNIVQVYDAGEFEGVYYIAMELVDGRGLDDILKDQRLFPVDRAIDIIIQAARGLAAASKKNLVHRDIKPGNLMITSEGIVKVADFGLAKNTEATHALTEAGSVLGTPSFMSPEQGKGQSADHRSDLYSLGVTLFAMVTGTLPFQGETPVSIVLKHMSEPPPDARTRNPAVPESLAQVLLKIMEKEPESRFQTADEFIAALEGVRAGIPGARITPSSLSGAMGPMTGSRDETLSLPGDVRPGPWNSVKAPSPATSATMMGVAAGGRRGIWIAVAAVVLLAVGAVALVVSGVIPVGGRPGSSGGAGGGTGPGPAPVPIDLRVLKPEDKAFLSRASVSVEGELRSGKIREILVNGQEAVLQGTAFAVEIPLKEGPSTIRVLVKGEQGNQKEAVVRVTVDTVSPVVELDPALSPGRPVRSSPVEVRGTVRDENPDRVFVNGERATLEGKRFSHTVGVVEGRNAIRVEVADLAGNRGAAETVVLRDSTRPEVTLEPVPETVESAEGALDLAGEANEDVREVRVNGEVVAARGRAFSRRVPLAPGLNEITVSVTDLAGNAWERKIPVRYRPLPAGVSPGAAPGVYRWARDGAEMARVPAGVFRMGSAASPEEGPARDVSLSEFYVDTREVTNARYAAFLEAFRKGEAGDVFHPGDPDKDPTPRFFEDSAFNGPEQPVVGVDWFDAWAYARWAGKSLPTEAQWERAAAGESGAASPREFPWGSEAPGPARAVFGKALNRTAPVGQHPAGDSACKCQDLAGNAAEWCLDWFVRDFYARPEARDADPCAAAPGPEKQKVVRGGSWRDREAYLRCASRRGAPPAGSLKEPYRSIGFRCVLNVPK